MAVAVAAGTGDVLMARLREGRANTARGAAHFLRETLQLRSLRPNTGLYPGLADFGATSLPKAPGKGLKRGKEAGGSGVLGQTSLVRAVLADLTLGRTAAPTGLDPDLQGGSGATLPRDGCGCSIDRDN